MAGDPAGWRQRWPVKAVSGRERLRCGPVFGIPGGVDPPDSAGAVADGGEIGGVTRSTVEASVDECGRGLCRPPPVLLLRRVNSIGPIVGLFF